MLLYFDDNVNVEKGILFLQLLKNLSEIGITFWWKRRLRSNQEVISNLIMREMSNQ
jgi:hypothetical protein